jgi:hypothetical protein
VNTARVPVQPPSPLVFDLPAESSSAGILQGSSAQATLAGKRVTVTGPFAPGTTLVQFAYAMPISSGEITVEQSMPAPLTQVLAMAQRVGEMQLTSPQLTQQREMQAEGQAYIRAQGPALEAGETVAFTFSGLPHAPVWPRNVALACAVLILVAGAWGSTRPARPQAPVKAKRGRLEAKRDGLFTELTHLEDQHRRDAVDPDRYAERRRELVAALERVYAELDEEAAA